MTGSALRVSVVVPVFDPGESIEPAIASILGQTLPAGAMEAIFVDDGSTDDTPARLDRLAAEHPDVVRVIHIEPSGAPGRPRNIGLAAARGDYVQFLDADDELAVDALERLVAMADRNRSDVVVAKFASASVPRSGRLFARNVDATTVAEMPGLADSSLGPTKLFRRAFLEQHEIRFPEGWRLMEDQVFTLRAYFRAEVVSILADHTCYFFNLRTDGLNLTAQPIEPDAHFAHLRDLVDLIEAETAPGSELRDRIVRRVVRVEVMRKVGEAMYPDLDDAARGRMFEAAASFLRDRVDPAAIAHLGALDRVRCDLLLNGRAAELLGLAQRTRDLGMTAVAERAGWRYGVYEVRVRASLAFDDAARPLVVVHKAGRWFLDPFIADELLGHPLDVTDDLRRFRLEIGLRVTRTAEEWRAKATIDPVPWATDDTDGEGGTAGATKALPPDGPPVPVEVTATVRIDPQHVGPDAVPIDPGTWQVAVRMSAFGIGRLGVVETAGGAAKAPGLSLRPALVGDPGRVVVPSVDEVGLWLDVDVPTAVISAALPARAMRVIRDGRRLGLLLPMAAGPAVPPTPVSLVVRTADGDRLLHGRFRPWLDRVVLDIPTIDLRGVPAGSYPLLLRFTGGEDDPDGPLGTARVDGTTRLAIEGAPRLGLRERLGLLRPWTVPRARTRLGAIRRRLPGARH